MGSAEESKRLDGERAGLIESALRVLGAMQRHRNDKHFGGSLAGKLRDRLGQHASKAFRRGMKMIVFEGVNGFPHPAVVNAKGDGADEGRRRKTACAAKH